MFGIYNGPPKENVLFALEQVGPEIRVIVVNSLGEKLSAFLDIEPQNNRVLRRQVNIEAIPALQQLCAAGEFYPQVV